jgi:DNA-directed RNA polymerase specialized sigma subunit
MKNSVNFEDYMVPCQKKAKSFAGKYHIELEELESEAYLILSNCLNSYDDEKGTPFDTYLHCSLNRGLQWFCEKNESLAGVHVKG